MCSRASLMLIESVFHCFPRDIVTWAPSTLRWRTNPNPESLALVAALAAPWSLTCGLQFLSFDPFRILQNPSESFRILQNPSDLSYFFSFSTVFGCASFCASEVLNVQHGAHGSRGSKFDSGLSSWRPHSQIRLIHSPSQTRWVSLHFLIPLLGERWPWLAWIDAELVGAEKTSITSIWSSDHYLILVDFHDCMRTMRNTHSNNKRFQLCSLM
jgi:hypothetical protein